MWNQVCRDLAAEDLARAASVVDGEEAVALDVLVHPGGRVAETLAQEAERRSADCIVLAEPAALARRERRRLRRRSPVPVSG
jgi:hypothetical protein